MINIDFMLSLRRSMLRLVLRHRKTNRSSETLMG